MKLLQILSSVLNSLHCRHSNALLRKYKNSGKRLPVHKHFWWCPDCHKSLGNLTYMKKGIV